MECPNCHQPVEAGAAFCGNCGQALQNTAPTQSAVAQSIPAYAVATPVQRNFETKTLLGILAGVIGIIGALFIPLAGLIFGIAGLITLTSVHIAKKWPKRIGFLLCTLAVLTGLATWAYAAEHDPRFNHHLKNSKTSATVTASLATQCYSANFIDKLNVSQTSTNCNITAYNGQTLDTSTDAYKVFATKSNIMNVLSFNNLSKQAIEKDVRTNLPGFVISNEQVSAFAGSPSYDINATNKSAGVAVIEAAVYHPINNGDNIFILLHAVTANTADLKTLEAQWQWK